MNLHDAVSGAISAVNPPETVSWVQSTGYTIAPTGKQVPQYADPVDLSAQVQPLSTKDLRQIEGLNLQGTLCKAYFYGEIDAIIRGASKGGDLITRPDGTRWLVTTVLEQWPDWCAVVLTLQV
ncbi:MAG: hypothetical protein GC190_19375 [Alphaproteobacteria bacterium]|nr:hypothetical protein [Alphaproteobacteria bacterium]